MIITKPQVDIDIVTNSLLKGGVVNVPIQGPIGLFNTLVELIKSNKKRIDMSNAISVIKQDFLWSWQGRINREMELLQEVSSMPILRKYPD